MPEFYILIFKLSIFYEAGARIELACSSFAESRLTTWLPGLATCLPAEAPQQRGEGGATRPAVSFIIIYFLIFDRLFAILRQRFVDSRNYFSHL